MSDITKIKVDGELESSYQLYPRNEEFAKRSGGGGSGVQPDLNQNDDTQPDYVKNRPFYTGDPVETVLLEETTVTINAGEETIISSSFPYSFEVGQTYIITFDGVDTEYTAYDAGGIVVVGYDYSSVGGGSGYIVVANNGSLALSTIDSSLDGSHTIAIKRYTQEIVKIDEKYLPVASDVNYGVIKKSEIVTAYYFDIIAPHDSMVEAVTSFEKGRANIAWHANNVVYARYDSSDDSISIVFSLNPYKIHTFKNLSGSYNLELGELSYSELNVRKLRIYDENNSNIYSVISTSGNSSGDVVIELNANHVALFSGEILNQKELFLFSSTENSNKKFKITVDDSGNLTATEVT